MISPMKKSLPVFAAMLMTGLLIAPTATHAQLVNAFKDPAPQAAVTTPRSAPIYLL